KHSFMKAKREKPLFPGELPTPSGKIELYSEKMKQAGFPALPTHTPLTCDDEYPFMYVPGPNHNFLNSTFSNNAKHIKLEKTPKLFINTKDA
ncbi:molybdopterin oxidoreductase family protein, partial [Bacillus spizizenii]|nr:molybdopterin oxidoreductase family protein [Bacillus spizizenii]